MKLLPGKFILFVFFLLAYSSINASDLRIRGQIKGLTSSDRKAVPVVLSGVDISIVLDNKPVDAKTNLAGVYEIILKKDKRYLMTISREGYHPKSLYINTKEIPQLKSGKNVELTDLDFLLLKIDAFPNDISSKEDMGQLSYDSKKRTFHLQANKDYRQNRLQKDQSLKLIRKSISYFGEEQELKAKEEERKTAVAQSNSKQSNSGADFVNEAEEKMPAIKHELLESITKFEEQEDVTIDDLESRREMIDSVRYELEEMKQNALTKEDSLDISRLEGKLILLEMDLKLAEKKINQQEEKIAIQGRLITFYIISSVLLLFILGVIFWFYRDKIKTNRELAEKNQLILDGIHYANTIQKSFLKTEEEIKSILPEFVLMFKPRDIVSGDIYWVSKVDSKTIIAAIDCTGHGVPGAFISMIANTLLNEIVNNRRILDPGKILEELHKGVMDLLKQDAGGMQSQDGMDMSLLVVDKNLKKMQFAGAKNHLYKISNGEIEVVKADLNSIGGRALRTKDGFNKKFTTKEVIYDTVSTYYLFSDGFMDQFGGPYKKKFNLPKFRELLTKCADLDIQQQQKMLHDSFDQWKGEEAQLDDVLVMGLKFS